MPTNSVVGGRDVDVEMADSDDVDLSHLPISDQQLWQQSATEDDGNS